MPLKLTRYEGQLLQVLFLGPEEGMTPREMDNELSCCEGTVHYILRKWEKAPYSFVSRTYGVYRHPLAPWKETPTYMSQTAVQGEGYEVTHPQRTASVWKLTPRGMKAAMKVSDIKAARRTAVPA